MRLQFAQANPYQLIERSVRVVSGFAKGIYDFFGSLVLIAVYLFLALVELRGFQRKLLHGAKGPLSRSLVEALSEDGKGIQRFVLARTFVGAGIGGLTALYCRITGLDFALVWGVLAFLLNYIPIFGAVVAVIPPVLLALIQPEAAWLTPTTLVGLTAIHVILGSYVDPWVQGRFLSLSPLVLLFSITLLAGCAGPRALVPHQSTIMDVRDKVGTPTDIRFDRNGEELWEYARGPAGYETHLVRIGGDGKVKEVTQLLTEERLRSIVPGRMSKADVRHLLGRPSDQSFLRTGTAWSWRFISSPQPGFLVVSFNPDNTVKETLVLLDPSEGDRRDRDRKGGRSSSRGGRD
ncbi:MAG: AI-2E family transporter [Betaproteobacteria bacterium]|nr:AI-2E family transporter [Betaproteobacteria bacterium]